MQKSSKSLILKRVAYGDADWIVTFFSREFGRMSGMAKFARSSKRRFGGALEPGTLVDLQFVGRNGSPLVRLDEAVALRSTNGILKSLDRINAMARALELSISFLQEHQPTPEKFDLLDRYLTWLNEHDPSVRETSAFEFKWLTRSGFMPGLERCMRCDKDVSRGANWVFDLDNGSLLCNACSSSSIAKLHVTNGALEGLYKISSGNFDVSSEKAMAAERILHRYTEYVLGKPLKYKPL
ncbi:MAG: DNA repair protein RecO [Deltaproteobacteria bacterium]|jgi:DNA repair protein RecO (recombination protein O)|nr:DNA repair protein RecO [Deltaproteobacteria bacterium]